VDGNIWREHMTLNGEGKSLMVCQLEVAHCKDGSCSPSILSIQRKFEKI